MQWYELLGYTLYLVIFVYLINCLIARRIVTVNLKTAALYTFVMAAFGVFGEVFVGSIYEFLFGRPLWQYQVAPVHNGYTSLFAPVIWGGLGLYVALLQDYLNKRGVKQIRHLAALFAIETLALELIANGSFLLFFDQYLFYYLPGDLWHLTSVQTLPFYLPAGIAFYLAIRHFRHSPEFYITMSAFLGTTLVILAR